MTATTYAGTLDVSTTTRPPMSRLVQVELRKMVDGRSADSALVFTCNGRGTHLFPEPDHDAMVVSESLSGAPVAGMFLSLIHI